MSAIVNTYTKTNPCMIVYRTIVRENRFKFKEVILFIQDENGMLTTDKTKAMTFTTTSAAIPHFVKIVNSLKKTIPQLREKIIKGEAVIVSISENRWIEIAMEELQLKKGSITKNQEQNNE